MTTTETQTPSTLQTPAFVAFHGDIAVKEKYLKRVRKHAAADKIVQGYGYWMDGKGCAVGCTLHSGDHAAYETELGIPRALAHMEDRIFEGLPVAEARTWPERFLAAAKPGADLTGVPWQMVHWLVASEIPATKNDEVEALRGKLLALLEPLIKGGPLDRDAFRALYAEAGPIRDRAYAARRAAWDALHEARRRRAASSSSSSVAAEAEAAAAVAAAAVAVAVVEVVAVAAAVAAVAAAAAVEVAVVEVEVVVAVVAVVEVVEVVEVVDYYAARRTSYIRQSEKLLELMSAAV